MFYALYKSLCFGLKSLDNLQSSYNYNYVILSPELAMGRATHWQALNFVRLFLIYRYPILFLTVKYLKIAGI